MLKINTAHKISLYALVSAACLFGVSNIANTSVLTHGPVLRSAPVQTVQFMQQPSSHVQHSQFAPQNAQRNMRIPLPRLAPHGTAPYGIAAQRMVTTQYNAVTMPQNIPPHSVASSQQNVNWPNPQAPIYGTPQGQNLPYHMAQMGRQYMAPGQRPLRNSQARYPKHNNLIKVGPIGFFLQDSSGELEGTGEAINDILTPQDYRVDVRDAKAFAGSYTRHIGDHFGIEVPIGLPITFDIKGAGAAAEVVDQIGTVKALPATVIANYYFTPRDATIRPYVGAAVNKTFFFDEEADPGLSAAVFGNSEIEIENSTGLGAFAGVNVRLSRNLHASLLAGYVDVKANAKIQTDTLPDLLQGNFIVDREIDVDLNPVVGLATIGVSF